MAIDEIVQPKEQMDIREPGQLQIPGLADNPLSDSYLESEVGAPQYLRDVDADSNLPQPAYQTDKQYV